MESNSEMDLTNTTINETLSHDEFNQSDVKRIIFFFSYFITVIGLSVVVANGSIFVILVKKKGMLPTDILVMCNLVIDALYGLTLFSVGIINLNHINLSQVTGIDSLKCIYRRVPYTFLVLASLLLFIVMTLNRYVAIHEPFRYKVVFQTSRVIKYLVAVAVTSLFIAGVDLVLCVSDPSEMDYYSQLFTIFWVYFKVVLLTTIVVLMFFVYKQISKQFVGSFWAPIFLPFKFLFTLQFLRFCFRKNKAKGALEDPSISNSTRKNTAKETMVGKTEMYLVPVASCQFEHGEHKTESMEVCNQKQLGKCEVDDCHSVGPSTPKHVIKATTTSDGSIVRSAGSLQTLDSTKRSQGKLSNEARRQRKQHHLTTMFFFICVVFILVSVPNSLFQLFTHWFPHKVSVNFAWKLYVLTETLYGLNFLLNPYLYSFNNSHVKHSFREFYKFIGKLFTFGDNRKRQGKEPRSRTRRPSKTSHRSQEDEEDV